MTLYKPDCISNYCIFYTSLLLESRLILYVLSPKVAIYAKTCSLQSKESCFRNPVYTYSSEKKRQLIIPAVIHLCITSVQCNLQTGVGACPEATSNVYAVSSHTEGCTTCFKFTRPITASECTIQTRNFFRILKFYILLQYSCT